MIRLVNFENPSKKLNVQDICNKNNVGKLFEVIEASEYHPTIKGHIILIVEHECKYIPIDLTDNSAWTNTIALKEYFVRELKENEKIELFNS